MEAERHELLKQVKETTITVQKVSDVVGIPGDVWLKAKMFDAELKNVVHVSGTKMVTFIMNQESKMDAILKAMKALLASCTELFPVKIQSSVDGETSSSYYDLTPQDVVEIQDAAAGGGNQLMEEEDQVEDITALTTPPVSTIEVVVPNTTPVSSIVGKETLDGCHVAEVTPPSPLLTFHVIARAPPPLAPLMPGIPPDSQLATPLAPDVTETGSRAGVISRPRGYEMSVAPPLAPSLAIDRVDRNKKHKQKKIEAKLKKRKDEK